MILNSFISSKILYLALCWFWVSSSSLENISSPLASVEISEKKLSSYQKKMYKKDASRLALRYVSKGDNYGSLGAVMPQEVVDELYTSLIAIHESPYKEAKEVTTKHRLHTFPVPAVDMFQVHYNKKSKWATPLRLGDNTTNSETIERICEEYGLKIQSHQTWDKNTNMFVVQAKSPVNLAAIAQEFMNEDGVTDIKLPKPNIDGNDIEAQKTAKGWRISYIIKFESCLTGCKKRHAWDFEVGNIKPNSANVNFLGEVGDDLPDWMK